MEPGDYDASNNSYMFSVEVVQDIQLVRYNLYCYWRDMDYFYDYNSVYWGRYIYSQQGRYESFYQTIWMNEDVVFPVDVSLAMGVDGGSSETLIWI